ncbi:MAG: hypothetical protein QXF24_08425 [Thermoproteota archaeon]
MGLGLSFLTILRGLSPIIQYLQFGDISGNSTLPLYMPPMWPPRNVAMTPYLSDGGEVEILIFDEPNYHLFLESKSATPLKELELGGDIVQFEVHVRGRYYVVLRNEGANTVNGEIIMTFWGFERDLTYLSMASLVFGIAFWTSGYLLKGRRIK